jgi:hypothetical protein
MSIMARLEVQSVPYHSDLRAVTESFIGRTGKVYVAPFNERPQLGYKLTLAITYTLKFANKT